MKRTQFTKLGQSPLLFKWVFHLQGTYHYVAPSSLPLNRDKTFAVIDADTVDHDSLKLFLNQNEFNNIYFVILSSDRVYTDLDSDLMIKPVSRMSEDWPTVIPSVLDPIAPDIINSLFVENLILSSGKPTTILRPFNVIDKDIYPADIRSYMKDGSIEGEGDFIRTYLHYEEFEYVATELLARLLNNKTGIYNIGNTDTVTYKHLVENIASFTSTSSEVIYRSSKKYVERWKIPDIMRVSATIRWQPQNTVRKTLWRVFSK